MKQVLILAALFILTVLVLPARGTQRVERMMNCTDYESSSMTCNKWEEK